MSATGPRWNIQIGEAPIKSNKVVAMCVPDRLAESHRSSPDSEVCRTLNLCKAAIPKDPKEPGDPKESTEGMDGCGSSEAFTNEG